MQQQPALSHSHSGCVVALIWGNKAEPLFSHIQYRPGRGNADGEKKKGFSLFGGAGIDINGLADGVWKRGERL